MLKNGAKVTTADAWWKQRRPEIVEDFEREVVGRVPADVPAVAGGRRDARVEVGASGRRPAAVGTSTTRLIPRSGSRFA